MKKEVNSQLNIIMEIAGNKSREFIQQHYKELLLILDTQGEKGLREYLIKHIDN